MAKRAMLSGYWRDWPLQRVVIEVIADKGGVASEDDIYKELVERRYEFSRLELYKAFLALETRGVISAKKRGNKFILQFTNSFLRQFRNR